MDKLTNGMSDCVILYGHVGKEERMATAPPDKSGDTLTSLTA